MDWQDSPEQAAFRNDVRTFIEERLPALYRERAERNMARSILDEEGWTADRASGNPQQQEAARSWAAALAERGWAAPHWPQEYGGAGLSVWEQYIFNQEMARAGAPTIGGSGITLLGPTLIVHGTEEQKRKYLPGILSGEAVWAQGYSEPGAGSDLASLQTRAVRDGDEYVVNGQKIWTSGAHNADKLFALVRTDPEAPKHRGISFMLIDDIHAPGLTIRPLISPSWKHIFNETFFEDVRVPAQNVLGDENRGWYVAMTLLDYERSSVDSAVIDRRTLDALIAEATGPRRDISRLGWLDSVRNELADRVIETQVSSSLALRIASMQASGVIPNYEASMGKMFGTECHQRVFRTGIKVWGIYANIWDADDAHAPLRAGMTHGYVDAIPMTIAGGSSEIQRNIIATRGLGLPRG